MKAALEPVLFAPNYTPSMENKASCPMGHSWRKRGGMTLPGKGCGIFYTVPGIQEMLNKGLLKSRRQDGSWLCGFCIRAEQGRHTEVMAVGAQRASHDENWTSAAVEERRICCQDLAKGPVEKNVSTLRIPNTAGVQKQELKCCAVAQRLKGSCINKGSSPGFMTPSQQEQRMAHIW